MGQEGVGVCKSEADFPRIQASGFDHILVNPMVAQNVYRCQLPKRAMSIPPCIAVLQRHLHRLCCASRYHADQRCSGQFLCVSSAISYSSSSGSSS